MASQDPPQAPALPNVTPVFLTLTGLSLPQWVLVRQIETISSAIVDMQFQLSLPPNPKIMESRGTQTISTRQTRKRHNRKRLTRQDDNKENDQPQASKRGMVRWYPHHITPGLIIPLGRIYLVWWRRPSKEETPHQYPTSGNPHCPAHRYSISEKPICLT